MDGMYGIVKAHWCIEDTGSRELLSVIVVAGIHNESTSRTTEDLSQLIQETKLNSCLLTM